MIILISKASDRSWHQIKEINTMEELLKINDRLVVERMLEKWNEWYNLDSLSPEEVKLIEKVEYEVTIYDAYIE